MAPESGAYRTGIGRLDAGAELGVLQLELDRHGEHRMGNLVNEDVGMGNPIALQADQVFLRNDQYGDRPARPQSASLQNGVPISSGRDQVQPRVLRDVGDHLALGHDGDARSRAGEHLDEVGAVGQHLVDEVSGLVQRSVVYRGRRDDGNSAGVQVLLVEGIEAKQAWRRPQGGKRRCGLCCWGGLFHRCRRAVDASSGHGLSVDVEPAPVGVQQRLLAGDQAISKRSKV